MQPSILLKHTILCVEDQDTLILKETPASNGWWLLSHACIYNCMPWLPQQPSLSANSQPASRVCGEQKRHMKRRIMGCLCRVQTHPRIRQPHQFVPSQQLTSGVVQGQSPYSPIQTIMWSSLLV